MSAFKFKQNIMLAVQQPFYTMSGNEHNASIYIRMNTLFHLIWIGCRSVIENSISETLLLDGGSHGPL